MDSVLPATPSQPASHVRFTHLGWALLALALATYGVLLALNVGAYAGGSDSSGYMNHARLLGEGRVHVAPRSIPQLKPGDISPWAYSALGFKPVSDGDSLVPTYPVGVPLLVLAAAKIAGWAEAGNVVLWLHGILGVMLVYLAGRTFGLSCRVALIGAVIVAASPLYLFMTLQAMSDVPALVWTTAAILAAWHSRNRATWAIGAGAAFAMAVLIRPTDALAIFPIAVALGCSWRRWLGFGAGGIPGAIFFCLHSHAAYGRYLTTGYGDSAGLATEWIVPTLIHYTRWLPIEFTPIAIGFLGLPLLWRRKKLEVLLLAVWVLVFAGFYSAYDCTHQTWWYLRFLLPAAPALVVGSLLVWQHFSPKQLSHRVAVLSAGAVLLLATGWSAHWDKELGALDPGRGEYAYPLVATWLKEHLPPEAVVAAMQHSGALFYYTQFTFVRWDEIDAASFRRLTDALESAHRPLYAALSPFEINEQDAFSKHMTFGAWTQIGKVRDVTIWRWSPRRSGDK